MIYFFKSEGRWYSPGPPVSSTNKTDRHDITEILLKVALNNIKQNKQTNNLLGNTCCAVNYAQTNLYQKFKDTNLVIRSRKGQTTQ
jgi:hypothetical protein